MPAETAAVPDLDLPAVRPAVELSAVEPAGDPAAAELATFCLAADAPPQLAALVAERDVLRARAERAEARLEALMRLSSDGFWELDGALRFVRCSGGDAVNGEELARLLVGRAPWELPATTPLSGEWDDLHSVLESGQAFADFVCVTRALGGAGERHLAFSGEPLPAPGGERARWHGIVRDVSHAHRAQERLRRLAHRDRLTGLPNRAATESALQQLLEDAAHDRFRVHVVFVDLDGFKGVNDRLGHAAGDRVLQEAANRLRSVLRDEDVLGRFGGDEFVAILSEQHAAGGDLAARVCARLREAMVPPILVDGVPCRVGASLGAAVYPDDAADLSGLLARADAAMYEAKRIRRREVAR
jgi:diguanylate cyclase (GGDEF)-like protein